MLGPHLTLNFPKKEKYMLKNHTDKNKVRKNP